MDPITNDAKLWEDFKKGEKYALTQIYYHYADSLFRYGKKFSSDDELVKDAIQDLFFDLIRTRAKLGTTDLDKFLQINPGELSSGLILELKFNI